MNIISGKLKFKGSFEDKMRFQKKVLQKKIDHAQEQTDDALNTLYNTEDSRPVNKIVSHEAAPGSGRILTSGVVVHGKDTKFNSELKRGDTIIFIDGTTAGGRVSGVVNMVYSDKSLSLRESLPRDVITYSQFDIKPQDEVVVENKDIESLYKNKLKMVEIEPEEKTTVVEVKRKSGMWGYKTIKKVVKGEVSREEMLKMRAQEKKEKWS